MKVLLSMVLTILAITCVSCADSIDDVEKKFQRGIERVKKARTPEELSQITADVRNDIINGANGIGGDRKLSEEELRRFDKTQLDYERAVEQRDYQLTSGIGFWDEEERKSN